MVGTDGTDDASERGEYTDAETDGDGTEDPIHAVASVTHGAVVSFGALSAQKVLLFGLNFLLTQSLSVRLYGVYAFANRLTMVLTRFVPLGSQNAVIRFLPKYDEDPDRKNRVLGLAYGTTLVSSLVFGVGVYLLAPTIDRLTLGEPVFVDAMRLFALLLPFNALVGLVAQYFRTLEMVEHHAAILYVGKPALRLFGAGVAVALGFSVLGVVGALTAVTAALAVGAFWLALSSTDARPTGGANGTELREFYDYSIPSALATVGAILRSRIDVVLVGAFLTATDAGIYNIVLLLIAVLAIPLAAFNQILPPVASRLYSDGDHAALNDVYGTITRYVFTLTALGAAILLVYRTELLAIFGTTYVRGEQVLAIFVAGRVVANACGATGWLLLMTDHQYLNMLNNWVLAVSNVVLSYLFILQFGLIGAALGTGGAIAVSNLLRLSELWYLEGLQPFDRSFATPLFAAFAAMLAMRGVETVLSGPILLAFGTVVGVGAFGAVLVWRGVEPEDRRLARMLARNYGFR